MRVISGKYRGKKLVSPLDDSVRPTTDRIKETVFNILQWDIAGARVLDLFCGSGALGIECLSRGAEEVVFVDKSRESTELTKTNLKGIDGNYRVVNADFLNVLRAHGKKFDLIFIDPPYKSGLGDIAVDAVFECDRLARGGIVVYEHSTEIPFNPSSDRLNVRTKVMGSVTVEFVTRKERAFVTGSFDPITKGHEYVIDRAAEEFGEVVVACLVNPEKEYFFTPEERLAVVRAAIEGKEGVSALYSEKSAVEAAAEAGATVLVRGVRGESDETYEREMADYNSRHGFDTVFIPSSEEFAELSSTQVRAELAKGDFHSLPECAIMTAKEIMKNKTKGKARQRGVADGND